MSRRYASDFCRKLPARGLRAVAMGMVGAVFLMYAIGCRTPMDSRSKPKNEPRSSRVEDTRRWVCYYGNDRGVLDVEGMDMFVLDPDSIGDITGEKQTDAIYLAYLCVGEAETYRWYWPKIKEEEWLIRENPSWPQHYLVDPRSREWRSLIVERVAARLLEKGYDGFMLDTLDTAEALVSEEALRYEGSASAMVRLVGELRQKYPEAVIVANGGLAIFPGISGYIDGVIYEGVRWTYDFATEEYRPRTQSEIEWIEERLQRVRNAGLPIFALDYVDPKKPEKAEEVAKALRKAGYRPFVSGVNLNSYPGEE